MNLADVNTTPAGTLTPLRPARTLPAQGSSGMLMMMARTTCGPTFLACLFKSTDDEGRMMHTLRRYTGDSGNEKKSVRET